MSFYFPTSKVSKYLNTLKLKTILIVTQTSLNFPKNMHYRTAHCGLKTVVRGETVWGKFSNLQQTLLNPKYSNLTALP